MGDDLSRTQRSEHDSRQNSWPPHYDGARAARRAGGGRLRASGKPTAGDGAKASLLGTTPRSDGKPQITYDGHPLYGYQGDSKAGETNGQGLNGFGAPWYVLSPTGNEITAASSSSGGGNNGY